ncbi:phage shock protein C (PspC) family protein [Blastococcus colisei]|uniref:Phage shock protein C (PspC) family protein n=2 Tax=Blastococcus colisei TaxID=1564162 RepID=A0A543PBG9_9ACTN|nr:phage shock protein C (PspC) family protein [Blastococcus colisei]
MEPPSWPPPPPEGPQPVRPQLRRSRTDKILGGVNGGLAEYSGIDALLWRVGFVALTLAAGTGVIVYLLLWVLMPAGPPSTAGAPAGTAVAKQPAGPRSPVPGLTIAGLLIAMGFLTLLNNVTDSDLGGRVFLGTALLVVGLGLVAAAFTRGRSSRGGLVALGVVLSLALVTVSTVDVSGSGVGDRTYRPATVAEVREVYRGGLGDVTVDLTRLDQGISGDPVTTRIEHGVGDLEVVVPRPADVRLQIDHGLGDVQVFDRGSETEGFFPGTGDRSWTDDGEPEFVLTIHAGLGDVEVRRG